MIYSLKCTHSRAFLNRLWLHSLYIYNRASSTDSFLNVFYEQLSLVCLFISGLLCYYALACWSCSCWSYWRTRDPFPSRKRGSGRIISRKANNVPYRLVLAVKLTSMFLFSNRIRLKAQRRAACPMPPRVRSKFPGFFLITIMLTIILLANAGRERIYCIL